MTKSSCCVIYENIDIVNMQPHMYDDDGDGS